jgi:hypothetical protein
MLFYHQALLSWQSPASFMMPLTVVTNWGASAENFDELPPRQPIGTSLMVLALWIQLSNP